MPIDIISEAQKLQTMYLDDPRQSSFNLLLLGESGSGKTFLSRTARLPVHIDSFDPGGTRATELREMVRKGEAVIDSRWEYEDPSKPAVYEEWKRTFLSRISGGYFDHFGTYVLDSSTTWSKAIMNWQLKKEGRAGEAPLFTKDYTPQKVEIENMIYRMMSLPCDFILTGHLEMTKDETTGKVKMRYMTTGKGAVIIPLLFSEMWVMTTKESSSGVAYHILTQRTGQYVAKTKLAKGGVLSTYEEADIKKLLKKCDRLLPDKPLLGEIKQVVSK